MVVALELLVNETVDCFANMNVKMIANGNCAKSNHFGFSTCSAGGACPLIGFECCTCISDKLEHIEN